MKEAGGSGQENGWAFQAEELLILETWKSIHMQGAKEKPVWPKEQA